MGPMCIPTFMLQNWFETLLLILISLNYLTGLISYLQNQFFNAINQLTSIATILVPYITFFPITSLALVMSSVSLTVPFIPDLISFGNRGLAYSYMGLIFVVAIVIIFLMIEVEVHRDVNVNLFFIVSGCIGLTTAFTLCWHFFDHYKNRVRSRNATIQQRLKKIMKGLNKSFKFDKGTDLIQASSFVIMHVIFSFFFVSTSEDITSTEKQKAVLYIITGLLLVPALFYTGIVADKRPGWRMLLREYICLLIFLVIFAIREGYSKHQDFLKLLGFAGCMFIIFNIYMTNMIILSKTVRRECRGAMYGIVSACLITI